MEDGLPNYQAPNPPEVYMTKKSFFKSKTFLIILGIILLILILLIWKWSDILKISQQSAKQESNLQTLPYTPPISISSAEEIVVNKLPKIFNSSALPDNHAYAFDQDKITKETFTIVWNKGEIKGGGYLTLAKDGKETSHMAISLTKKNSSPPTVQSSAQIAKQNFLISPQGKWVCKPSRDITYCENFWKDEKGIKKGISVSGLYPTNDGQKMEVISYCEFTPEDPNYSWQSCVAEFASDGVK